jgi:hypothetical protein
MEDVYMKKKYVLITVIAVAVGLTSIGAIATNKFGGMTKAQKISKRDELLLVSGVKNNLLKSKDIVL